MRPVVSFVIPVKNDASRLQRCLASITANVYPRDLIDIIVVDNESSDASAQVSRDAGATVVRSAARSVAELRNGGAERARGTILAFVDADHEIDPGWIQAAVEVLSGHDIGATGTLCMTDPSPNWVQRQYDAMRGRLMVRQEVSWLGSGNLAVKKRVFDNVGRFDARLTACEDVDLCNRLRNAGFRIVADPAMRNVHYGDPRTLMALFYGELWRGRDNLRVTFRGPKTFRHLRSALIPVIQLIAMIAGVVALPLGYADVAAGCWLVVLSLIALRAGLIARRQANFTVSGATQALLVATVFDVARALALLVQGSHRARRAA